MTYQDGGGNGFDRAKLKLAKKWYGKKTRASFWLQEIWARGLVGGAAVFKTPTSVSEGARRPLGASACLRGEDLAKARSRSFCHPAHELLHRRGVSLPPHDVPVEGSMG